MFFIARRTRVCNHARFASTTSCHTRRQRPRHLGRPETTLLVAGKTCLSTTGSHATARCACNSSPMATSLDHPPLLGTRGLLCHQSQSTESRTCEVCAKCSWCACPSTVGIATVRLYQPVDLCACWRRLRTRRTARCALSLSKCLTGPCTACESRLAPPPASMSSSSCHSSASFGSCSAGIAAWPPCTTQYAVCLSLISAILSWAYSALVHGLAVATLRTLLHSPPAAASALSERSGAGERSRSSCTRANVRRRFSGVRFRGGGCLLGMLDSELVPLSAGFPDVGSSRVNALLSIGFIFKFSCVLSTASQVIVLLACLCSRRLSISQRAKYCRASLCTCKHARKVVPRRFKCQRLPPSAVSPLSGSFTSTLLHGTGSG